MKIGKKTRKAFRSFKSALGEVKKGLVSTGRELKHQAKVVQAFSRPIAESTVSGFRPVPSQRKIEVDIRPRRRQHPRRRDNVDWNGIGVRY